MDGDDLETVKIRFYLTIPSHVICILSRVGIYLTYLESGDFACVLNHHNQLKSYAIYKY